VVAILVQVPDYVAETEEEDVEIRWLMALSRSRGMHFEQQCCVGFRIAIMQHVVIFLAYDTIK